MKILLKIAALAAVAALAAGCCSCRSYQKKNRRPLVGTEWQLIQLGGKAVKPEEGKFTLTFLAEENRIAGVGACNRIMGKYEATEKGVLTIGPLALSLAASTPIVPEACHCSMLPGASCMSSTDEVAPP